MSGACWFGATAHGFPPFNAICIRHRGKRFLPKHCPRRVSACSRNLHSRGASSIWRSCRRGSLTWRWMGNPPIGPPVGAGRTTITGAICNCKASVGGFAGSGFMNCARTCRAVSRGWWLGCAKIQPEPRNERGARPPRRGFPRPRGNPWDARESESVKHCIVPPRRRGDARHVPERPGRACSPTRDLCGGPRPRFPARTV